MLREATLDDISVLVDMMEEFYAESDYSLDHVEAAAAFQALISQPHYGAIWLVFDGSKVTGYVILTIRFAMEFGGLDGSIDDLYIRPEARRKGFASHRQPLSCRNFSASALATSPVTKITRRAACGAATSSCR